MALPSGNPPGSTIATPLLETTGLSLSYGAGVSALQGVDLVVPGAGITCLLGANGAGKTSLLELAAGLRKPTGGRLRVLGRQPGSPVNRLELGVMLQDGGLPGSARPREFLEYVARLYPKPREVSDLLAAIEITDKARLPIRRLSGGEQRRIAWAAAMVGNPTALILDEPTASIDPIGRDRMYDVLRAERDRGTAIIISTHLTEDVEALADFIVVLHDGCVALTGSPKQLRPSDSLIVRTEREMDHAALLAALPAGSRCERQGRDAYRVDVPSGLDASVMATVSSWCTQHSVSPDIALADLRTVLLSALKSGTS